MTDTENGARTTDKKTVIEEGSELRGGLTSTTTIMVRGKIDGEIKGPALEVMASGVVTGKIKVGELRAHGELGGDIEADTVELGGRIHDKTIITARSIEVAAGAATPTVFGACELAIGDAPNKATAVTAAQAAARATEKPAAAKAAVLPQTAPVPAAPATAGDTTPSQAVAVAAAAAAAELV